MVFGYMRMPYCVSLSTSHWTTNIVTSGWLATLNFWSFLRLASGMGFHCGIGSGLRFFSFVRPSCHFFVASAVLSFVSRSRPSNQSCKASFTSNPSNSGCLMALTSCSSTAFLMRYSYSVSSSPGRTESPAMAATAKTMKIYFRRRIAFYIIRYRVNSYSASMMALLTKSDS